MGPLLRRDLAAGLAAGLAAALLLHGMATWDAVRAGAGGWTILGTLAGDLASGAAGGAAFAAVFRYQPGSPAFSASGGLLFGLLWWVVGPLTAAPVWSGHLPDLSVREAGDAFPALSGHVLYGALLGIGFYTVASLRGRAAPMPGPEGRRAAAPPGRSLFSAGSPASARRNGSSTCSAGAATSVSCW